VLDLKSFRYHLWTTLQNWFVYLFLNNWIGKYENRENIYRQNFLNVSSFLPLLFFIRCLTHSPLCYLFISFLCSLIFLQINIILLWWGFSLFLCVKMKSQVRIFVSKALIFFLDLWRLERLPSAVRLSMSAYSFFIMSVIKSLILFFLYHCYDWHFYTFQLCCSRSLFCV